MHLFSIVSSPCKGIIFGDLSLGLVVCRNLEYLRLHQSNRFNQGVIANEVKQSVHSIKYVRLLHFVRNDAPMEGIALIKTHIFTVIFPL
jgi:hypothetical protein